MYKALNVILRLADILIISMQSLQSVIINWNYINLNKKKVGFT